MAGPTGWLEFAATINPVTYVLRGMRELTMEGWAWTAVGKAMLSIGGMAIVTFSLTALAARGRMKQ